MAKTMNISAGIREPLYFENLTFWVSSSILAGISEKTKNLITVYKKE
jgi:hypothetical protein